VHDVLEHSQPVPHHSCQDAVLEGLALLEGVGSASRQFGVEVQVAQELQLVEVVLDRERRKLHGFPKRNCFISLAHLEIKQKGGNRDAFSLQVFDELFRDLALRRPDFSSGPLSVGGLEEVIEDHVEN
jgi:hypothetical protein